MRQFRVGTNWTLPDCDPSGLAKLGPQNWDNEIPEDIRKMFLKWHSDIPHLGQLAIPRCFFLRPVDQIELHMIRNSSQDPSVRLGFCVHEPRVRTKLKYPSLW